MLKAIGNQWMIKSHEYFLQRNVKREQPSRLDGTIYSYQERVLLLFGRRGTNPVGHVSGKSVDGSMFFFGMEMDEMLWTIIPSYLHCTLPASRIRGGDTAPCDNF